MYESKSGLCILSSQYGMCKRTVVCLESVELDSIADRDFAARMRARDERGRERAAYARVRNKLKQIEPEYL